MNKKELAAEIAKRTGVDDKTSLQVLQSFVEVVGDELKNGGNVQLLGFGTFDLLSRAERQGRNPLTGETITIQASKTPHFKAGKALKDKVNA